MSSAKDVELLEADARYYHDRVALLRAKLCRWVQPRNWRSSSAAWRAPNYDCASGVYASRADRAMQRSGRALSPSQRSIKQVPDQFRDVNVEGSWM